MAAQGRDSTSTAKAQFLLEVFKPAQSLISSPFLLHPINKSSHPYGPCAPPYSLVTYSCYHTIRDSPLQPYRLAIQQPERRSTPAYARTQQYRMFLGHF